MLSKLQPPPARSEMVARPSLVEKLRTGLRSGEAFVRRLTLLSAPAGSGKTSLAAEWLRTGDYGYAWLSLDENDNDPVRFITYLVGALQGVNGELGKAAQEMLKSPQMPPLNDMRTSDAGPRRLSLHPVAACTPGDPVSPGIPAGKPAFGDNHP